VAPSDKHRREGRDDNLVRVPDTPALSRQRVLASLEAASAHPLTLLVAPAGAGKTTALAQLVRATPHRAAWYRVERGAHTPDDFVRDIGAALQAVAPEVGAGWTDAGVALRLLRRASLAERTLLVIDDLHELQGGASDVLEELVWALPPWLSILAASRRSPDGLARLRVAGHLEELPADILRWRTWEVERLFQEFYRQPLRPEAAARLTLRTEGWVAGLQLFHLASHRLSPAGRSRLIEQLHTRPGLVCDYLADNVLAALPERLHDFLVDTCVLGVVEPGLCDALRDRDDSHELLTDLTSRQLFTLPREDGAGYRYHEVLRAHLEIRLIERYGTSGVRARYQRAGVLMEATDATSEALYAYARAEAWDDVARLLGTDGPRLAEGGASLVLGWLPPSLVQGDPWLRLAHARALVADGRLGDALVAYLEAEKSFGTHDGSHICRTERAALLVWVEPREQPPRTLTDLLRSAIRRDPRRVGTIAAEQGTPSAVVVAALASLIAGAADEARQLARRASTIPDIEVFTLAAARAIEHVADLMSGRSIERGDLSESSETFEQLGSTWIALMVRAIDSAESPKAQDEVEAIRVILAGRSDPWGVPLIDLIDGVARVARGRPDPEMLARSADGFRRAGAPVLEAWARAWGALATTCAGSPDALPASEAARSLARAVGAPGAEAVAELAAGMTAPEGGGLVRAHGLADELGLKFPFDPPPTADRVVRLVEPERRIHCFGGLRVSVGDRPIHLEDLKPQSRQVLSMLAATAGSPIHREQIADALWPDDAGQEPTFRRIQVLVSTVRHHLESASAASTSWQPLVRVGDAYVLETDGLYVDTVAFHEAVATASGARQSGDTEAEMRALRTAFASYGGELLPEFGPASWLVDQRESYRRRYLQVAQALGGLHLADGDAESCVDVCLAGLAADRYHSVLWSLLAEAYRRTGDLAAARRVEDDHALVLFELGIDPSLATNGRYRAS
jgi:DNA-binding SARP family transcriptional activator